MKAKQWPLWLCLLVFVSLAGCPGTPVREANQSLTGLVNTLETARRSGDQALMDTTIAALDSLASAKASEARGESDPLNQISLFRIATTAAWQAGSTDVVAFGQEGQALCTEERFNEAPRDCSMLLVLPTLASVDAISARYKILQPQVFAPGAVVSDDDRRQAEQIYDDYSEALDTVLDNRSTIIDSDAHSTVKDAVDVNIGSLYCEHLKINSLAILAQVDSTRLDAERQVFVERDCDLVRDGVSRELLPCVTAACN